MKKFKNTIVIDTDDTDDIDDPNSVKVIKNHKSFKTKTDFKQIDKKVTILNKKDLNKILDKNKGKNIIFVGFLHDGLNHLLKKVNKTYMIDIDPDILWK